MIHHRSPETLVMSLHAYTICNNIIFGAYLWEWAITLDFDLLYLSGKKKFTLAAAAYFLTRYTGLLGWIIGMRMINVFEPINCTAWNYAINVVGYSALSIASFLLLLRVCALSSRNIFVMVFVSALYAATWAIWIWGTYNSHAEYVPGLHLCAGSDLKSHRNNSVMSFAFDSSCVALMMFYILRSRSTESDRGSLWRLIRQQGVAYAACIAVAYIPVIVLHSLEVNDAVAQVSNIVGLFIVTVCAMRMHRGLVMYQEASSRNNTSTSQSNQVSDGMIRFNNPPSVARNRKDGMGITISVDKFDDSETAQGPYEMKRSDSVRKVAYHDPLSREQV